MKALLLVAFCIASAAPAQAATAFRGGADLYTSCTTSRGADFCDAYIMGAVDAMFALKNASGAGNVCITDGVRLRQVRDIVVQYMKDHPETRRYTAASIVVVAVRKAFPCGESRGGAPSRRPDNPK
jgi:Rap1a immunity proteins